jgi:hypothetical protein
MARSSELEEKVRTWVRLLALSSFATENRLFYSQDIAQYPEDESLLRESLG